MESTYFSIVTDVGTEEMLKAIQEERKVNITSFAVGDGNGAYYTPTKDMTALKQEVWRGTVNSCKISEENANVLVIESVIPHDVGGFTIREMGVFDENGYMIAICNTPDTQKVKVSDGVVHELLLKMEILLSNEESVQLLVDPNVVTATQSDLNLLRNTLEERITAINATVQEEVQEALKITAGVQREVDGVKNNMLQMGMVLSALTDAEVIGSDNIAIENFNTMADITLENGMYDSEKHYLYA